MRLVVKTIVVRKSLGHYDCPGSTPGSPTNKRVLLRYIYVRSLRLVQRQIIFGKITYILTRLTSVKEGIVLIMKQQKVVLNAAVGFSKEIHIIDPTDKDKRYHKTYCGISFCVAELTNKETTCEICAKQPRGKEMKKKNIEEEVGALYLKVKDIPPDIEIIPGITGGELLDTLKNMRGFIDISLFELGEDFIKE